jgi:hypothetical protein
MAMLMKMEIIAVSTSDREVGVDDGLRVVVAIASALMA